MVEATIGGKGQKRVKSNHIWQRRWGNWILKWQKWVKSGKWGDKVMKRG